MWCASCWRAGTEAERLRRVGLVCGPAFVEHAVLVERAAADLRLWGWVSLPTFSRSQADLQHFFVNGRSIRDKLVAHAIKQAYADVLYHGRQPAYVLYLELPAAGVDVNVHPTKHEVRFRDSRMVHDFLFSSLHRALAEVTPAAVVGSGGGQRGRGVRVALRRTMACLTGPVCRPGVAGRLRTRLAAIMELAPRLAPVGSLRAVACPTAAAWPMVRVHTLAVHRTMALRVMALHTMVLHTMALHTMVRRVMALRTMVRRTMVHRTMVRRAMTRRTRCTMVMHLTLLPRRAGLTAGLTMARPTARSMATVPTLAAPVSK